MRARRMTWCQHCRRMVWPDILIGKGEEIGTAKDIATPFCPICNCTLPISAIEEGE